MSTAVTEPKPDPIVEYFRGFAVLRETRMEYWAIQLINFLDHTAYFALYGIVVVLLSDDFGLSDVNAGYVFTAFTLTVTASLWVSGFFTDWLGIRKAIILAMVASLGLRALVVWAALTPALPYRVPLACAAIIGMAPFMAMTATIFQAANRRFTTGKSRGAGFNLWYLFMNVGAFCGGVLIDLVRRDLGLPNAYILAFGLGSAVVCTLAAIVLIRREDQLYGEGEAAAEPAKAAEKRNPLQIAMAVAQEPVFWRFLVLITLLLGVRAVFLYLHLLCPKYWLRVIGPDAPIGWLQAVNPLLVVIGLMLVIPVLTRFSVYSMLTYGALVSSLSLFVLAIPGHGQDALWLSYGFLLVLTIGEIVWSPRLTEYTAAIAPKGQEGTYLGLSMVPWFGAKTIVAAASGHLLNRWVPQTEEGQTPLLERLAAGEVAYWDSPAAMWLVLGVITLVGPLIAIALRGFFTKGAHFEKHANAH
ncbi:MAG: MFS transporter [Phycisphaerales bacterium]|nr:MFS transporter [Phycisphaerales bacterium]